VGELRRVRCPTYLALADTVRAPFILGFAFVGGCAAAFLISAAICATAAVVLVYRV
jgi:hypothetical protein